MKWWLGAQFFSIKNIICVRCVYSEEWVFICYGTLTFLRMGIFSLYVDFRLTYASVFQASPPGGSQHELGGLVWEDVEGQESFPVSASAGFELTTQRLLVQEHNYSAITHTRLVIK